MKPRPTIHRHARKTSIAGFHSRTLILSFGLAVSGMALHSVQAADITLTASNGVDTSGFNATTGWSNGLDPAPGNAYFTNALTLRSPAAAGSYTFAGDSLTVGGTAGAAAGKFLIKSNTGTTLSANYILNGGIIHHGSNTLGAAPTLAGTINVLGNSFLGVNSVSAADRAVLDVTATISGSATLQVGLTANTTFGGSNVAVAGLFGTARLSGDNSYSGNLTVVGAISANASPTNGMLQLNHLNAVKNATVTLNTTGTAAPTMTFLDTSNTGGYHIGALATGAVNTPGLVLNDTVGTAVTISVGSKAGNNTFGGVISGLGSIAKVGIDSTWTLSGANTYSGHTTVSEGTLIFSSSAQSIGSLTVANGAGITVRAAPSTTVLTSLDLTLGTASGPTNLAFDFNALDISSPFLATGALTFNGIVNLSFANAGALTTATYPLIQYGSISGTVPAGSFAIGTRSTGTLVHNLANQMLNLAVTADLPKWTGVDSGNWVVGATGPGKNWKLANANTATDYIQGDPVLFDDSAAGTKSVVISAAPVTPGSVTFNTATSLYTLDGAFGIAGATPLIKNGSGTLTIRNTNTYTGPTTINEGTLRIGDGVTDGSISGSSNIVNEGILVYDRIGSFAYGGVISGNGSLVKNGPGIQTLTAANTYLGSTTVTAGILRNVINSAIPNSTELTVSGGTYDLGGFTQTVLNLSDGGSSAGVVTNTGTARALTVNSFADTTFSGLISGAVNLTKAGGGKLTLSGANTYNGITIISAGTIAIGNNAAFGTGQLNLGGTVESTDGTTRTIANAPNIALDVTFAGSGDLEFTGSYAAGNATTRTYTVTNTNTTFSGALVGTAGRIKAGPGTLTFSGLNTYTGPTTVIEGVLRITQPVLADASAVEIGPSGVLNLPHGATDIVGSLTIDGVVKGNGVYSAATDPGFITGTGRIQVGVSPGYALWASGFPFTVGVNDGSTQDADGDGIANVLEYVLGGIPVGTGSNDPSILPSQTLTSTDLVLTFKRSDLSELDVVLKAQWSTDLTAWNDFATIGAGDALPAVDVTEDFPTAALDTVVVTIPRSDAASGKLFGRVQAVK